MGFSERVILDFSLRIITGLANLHKSNIIHRDLFLRNILLGETTEDVAICDFGLSRQVDTSCGNYTLTSDSKVPTDLAPELRDVLDKFKKNRDKSKVPRLVFNSATDIYDYGRLIWTLIILGEKPGQLDEDVKFIFFRNLIKMCTQRNPKFRPSAEKVQKIIQHELNNGKYENTDGQQSYQSFGEIRKEQFREQADYLYTGVTAVAEDNDKSSEDSESMILVREWLKKGGFGAYAEGFKEAGYASLPEIKELSDVFVMEMIRDVGVKGGKKGKLFNYIQQTKPDMPDS